MLRKILPLALFLCTFLTVPASATPSSIIWIPSTDIQSRDKTHLGIDNYFTMNRLKPGESTAAFTTPIIGLTWGAKNFEFGFDYVTSQDSPFYFNAKAKLFGKKATDLNMVVGIYNWGTTSLTNQEVKYLLSSMSTKDGTRFSLGYGIGREEALGSDNKMLLAAIDKQLNDKWWIGMDYQSGKSALGALSFGVGYSLTPNASILLGYDIYNNSAYKNTVTVQLDVNF